MDRTDMTSLVAEEMVAYSNSKQRYYDDLAAQEYQFMQGEAKSMEEGIIKGRADGLKEGLLMTAKKMIEFGQPLDFIHKITGLPYDELTALCNE